MSKEEVQANIAMVHEKQPVAPEIKVEYTGQNHAGRRRELLKARKIMKLAGKGYDPEDIVKKMGFINPDAGLKYVQLILGTFVQPK